MGSPPNMVQFGIGFPRFNTLTGLPKINRMRFSDRAQVIIGTLLFTIYTTRIHHISILSCVLRCQVAGRAKSVVSVELMNGDRL